MRSIINFLKSFFKLPVIKEVKNAIILLSLFSNLVLILFVSNSSIVYIIKILARIL